VDEFAHIASVRLPKERSPWRGQTPKKEGKKKKKGKKRCPCLRSHAGIDTTFTAQERNKRGEKKKRSSRKKREDKRRGD